ncbi:uncharacterized protein B0H64DRAFT_412708 [Chaetomium fimeti]|uniref:Uncharacterized protein n=1 Tax=Chaetomium fimeti TaxID=1854472 RepID=A0AAE0H5X6_9PEZI|nr:hypothetical protein B0H64DRAFT_412708 [Chaetomium fimeti]
MISRQSGPGLWCRVSGKQHQSAGQFCAHRSYSTPLHLQPQYRPLIPLCSMGCGGSKEEATEQHHGSLAGARPSRKPAEDSDTLSDLSVRPVLRSSQPGHTRPPTRRTTAQVSKPKQPDGRVNSANPSTSFQYVSPQGNISLKRVEHIVAKSPAPPAKPLKGMRYPKRYWNGEGPADNRTQNFSDWEIRQTQDPADGRSTETYEYPIKTLVQKPPFRSEFNFAKKPATLKQCIPIPPPDRRGYKERWERPPNEPGAIRAVVNKDQQLVGAMYHPEGDTHGFLSARLEPLDGTGRGEVARYNDRQQTGRDTWPKRGPD